MTPDSEYNPGAMNDELKKALAALLAETGQAHHKAFEATDGADPDWPIWYADYLKERFAKQFGLEFTRSKLIWCLMNADNEHQAREPDADWATFYANEIVERCAPSADAATDKLALYYFDACPFCMMVLGEIERLGVDVELRSIHREPQHQADLVAARGRATVPVLRITSPDGEDRWMPESRDIIAYLHKTYG